MTTTTKRTGQGAHIRKTKRTNTPKPFRQGDLDALCGVYALINAVRQGTQTLAPPKRIDWEGLFAAILQDIAKKSTLANSAIWGLSPSQLRGRVRVAHRWLKAEYGLAIELSQPWQLHRYMDIADECRKLAQLISQPGHVAIIGFITRYHSHWSVIRRINHRSIILCDSGRMSRLTIARMCFNSEEKLEEGKKVVMSSDDLLVLKICMAD